MANDNSGESQTPKTQITLAWISFLGVAITALAAVLAALLPNWNQIFSSEQSISSSSPPSQPLMVFQVWGKEVPLQSNTEVPAGSGRVKVKIDNLSPAEQEKLWIYVRSSGNDLYYLDKLNHSSEGVWETIDRVQFGLVGYDGCLQYEVGTVIYDSPSATVEYDDGLKELPGTRLGSPIILIREPVGEQRC